MEGMEFMSFIKVENLVKKYESNTAVSGISMGIEKGELFGLLGPNGAGKSTTIAMISGLLQPTTGNIYINGIDIEKKPMEGKKLLGLVPQDIALYPTLTAKENLEFWGKMYNLRGKELKKRVEEVLEIAGLSDRKNERIEKYSGGMKRRINIGAALLHKPEILIMDEPTVGIDPQSRNHILDTVKMLNEEGMTVIYTSHYMEEVEFLCDKIGIIDHGKLLAFGEKEELKRSIINFDKIELQLSSITPSVKERINGLEHVQSIDIDGSKVTINSSESEKLLVNILSALAKMSIKVLSVKIQEPNLESVFLNLTGRALRD